MQWLRIAYKGLFFFLLSLITIPLQILILAFHRGAGAYVLPSFWQRAICRVFGLKVIVEGQPLRRQQVLYVCNHISYLDIPVIGSVLQASFIAKNDVATWPVFGFLSRLQQTAFISRSRNDARREKNALSSMLDQGKSLILFPEGTSTDGRDIAPFKSSLFSMALDDNRHNLMIQPVTLRVESVDGKPATGQAARDMYAWYGDMTMPPHLKAFTASRGAVIHLVFHPAFDPAAFSDRKSIADHSSTLVRSGLDCSYIASPVSG